MDEQEGFCHFGWTSYFQKRRQMGEPQDANTPTSHLGAVQRAQRFVSAAADLPQRGAKAPAVCGQAQPLGVLDALGWYPRDPVHQD